MTEIKKKLNDIDTRFLEGEELSDSDVQFLFDTLNDAHARTASYAAVILSQLGKPVILRLIEHYEKLTPLMQRVVIPLLASCPFNEAYFFLFEVLKKSKNKKTDALIILSLAKTDYFVFPILISFLNQKDDPFLFKLKKLLSTIGFATLRPFLTMFPELPHETILRETFGDDLIDSLK